MPHAELAPNHRLVRLLKSAGITSAENFELYAYQVPDRDDISAWRGSKRGVIVPSGVGQLSRGSAPLESYQDREPLGDQDHKLQHAIDEGLRQGVLL